MPNKVDVSLLKAALIGYEHQRQDIEQKIAEIRKQLDVRTSSSDRTEPKRKMSAAARKRIAAAQKKRWAEFRKQETPKAVTVKKTAPKRKLSSAAKAKLAANLKKARAARAAKKSAGQAVPF